MNVCGHKSHWTEKVPYRTSKGMTDQRMVVGWNRFTHVAEYCDEGYLATRKK